MINYSLKIATIIFSLALIISSPLQSKDAEKLNWITFEQLEDSLKVKPKKVLIDFYTDWCSYCRKMDKVVFTKSEVINLLNEEYYVVRFDAETELPIKFGSQTFINDQVGKSRTPVHQLAQILGTRTGNFTPPALVFLDEDFTVVKRYFEYMDSKKFIEELKDN